MKPWQRQRTQLVTVEHKAVPPTQFPLEKIDPFKIRIWNNKRKFYEKIRKKWETSENKLDNR